MIRVKVAEAGFKFVKRHLKGKTFIAVWSPDRTDREIEKDIKTGIPFHLFNEETEEIDWSGQEKETTFKR